VVARHTRRSGRHATSGCVCIDCGTRYLLTNTYKGNYCPDCHETWVARQRDDPPTARSPPRFGPSLSVEDDTDADDTDADDVEDPYDTA
jgi:DNA-directed RNA polymerase subunit RPC12/RpoP